MNLELECEEQAGVPVPTEELPEWLTGNNSWMAAWTGVDHTHLNELARATAQTVKATGAGAAWLTPGDETRYMATVLDTEQMLVMSTKGNGYSERYILSFGTYGSHGRWDYNMTFGGPNYPGDAMVERIAGAGGWTQVVCWIWLGYLGQWLTGNRLPWVGRATETNTDSS